MNVWDEVRNLRQQLDPAWKPKSLCDRLLAEGRHDLVERLALAEKRTPGFTTIVVPEAGFSDDDTTHNEVVAWLKRRRINVCNPGLLIERMGRACSWRGRQGNYAAHAPTPT